MSKTWQWLMKNKKKTKEEKEILDKAMEKAITPEVELAIARATKPDFSYFTFLRRYTPLIGVIGLLMMFVMIDAKLETHFGEEEWSSMLDNASEENKDSVTSITTVLPIILIMVLMMVGFDFYGMFIHWRYENKLKKKILEGVRK